jgi:hypothetical protein
MARRTHEGAPRPAGRGRAVGLLFGHGREENGTRSYVSPDLLRPRMEHLRRLPLQERVQLQGKLIGLPVGRTRA